MGIGIYDSLLIERKGKRKKIKSRFIVILKNIKGIYMKKNVVVESFDLDCGVYEYVICLTYGNYTKKYIIYGFSEYDCKIKKNNFIKEWFRTQKELAEFIGE